MRRHLKQGWWLTGQHFFIVIVLFLYELLWGFFLYRTIDSIITPLLQRYPGAEGGEDAVRLFLTEAQFQLMKTDLIHPYLWLFASLLAGRMLITPLVNAGLFYSLHASESEGGTRFLAGIRAAWKPVTLLYFLEVALTIVPGIWLVPRLYHALIGSDTLAELSASALPLAGGWFAGAVLLHLLFLAMQFGAVSGKGALGGLGDALKKLLPFAGVSLFMWAIGLALSLTAASVSMLWAGLLALILHQGFHFVRTIMKVWTVATQYAAWQSNEAKEG